MYNIIVIKSCKKLATERTKHMNKINDKKQLTAKCYLYLIQFGNDLTMFLKADIKR